jgi:hypothetical protein
MGKVINAKIPDTALVAQWIFRKLRNHHPMSEHDSKHRHALAREKVREYQLAPDSDTVRYALNDGRVFEITVKLVEGKLPAMVHEKIEA